MSNPQEFKKIEYIKVALNNKEMRIYNPSKDLKCLGNQVKTHFREINKMNMSATPFIGENEFAVQWKTNEELIIISENDQLEEIYLMHGLSKDNKIPKFQVLAREIDIERQQLLDENKNQELRGSHYTQSQFQSCYQSMSAIQQLQEEQKGDNVQQSHILEEIKSSKSEDVSDEEDSDASFENDQLEYNKLLQSFRHHIRLEIEKEAIGLFDKEAELKQLIDEKEGLIEQGEEEEKIENSQQIDISVSITQNEVEYNRNLAKFQLPILQSFKNFFQKKIIPKDVQQYSMITSQPELYLESELNCQCNLRWTVQNQTQTEWPKGIQLVHVYSQPIALIDNQDLKTVLRPGEIQEIQISLFIPQDLKEDHQIVMFRLKESDDGYIGQPLIAFIQVKRENQIQQSQNQSDQEQQVEKQRKDSEEQLLSSASALFDEGYGSFDRCFNLIRVVRGDLKKAREYLSQLIFYECQQ